MAPLVVGGEQRVAVELDAAQPTGEARAVARRHGEAGRARQLLRDAILQREEIAGGAVDFGAADDHARLHVDEARRQPHVAADALVGAGGDERGAHQLADGDGARHVDVGGRLQLLLGEHGVEPPALDDAQAGHGAQVGRHRLADRLADGAAPAREIGERQHRDGRRRRRRVRDRSGSEGEEQDRTHE